MEFSPFNNIVKLILQGKRMEEMHKPEESNKYFIQAWNEAQDDFEKFISAHFLGQHQIDIDDKLKWLQTALQLGLKINDDSVNSAIPSLYSNIGNCYEVLNDMETSKNYKDKATTFNHKPSETGPFFHGTKADLNIGDLLTSGGASNYEPELKMNHVYFTSLINGAGLAASLSKGNGQERVYVVEPTGSFENDPNLTNKKFPGNPTRSYRSKAPLKIIGEIKDWTKPASEQLEKFREKIDKNKGKIIN